MRIAALLLAAFVCSIGHSSELAAPPEPVDLGVSASVAPDPATSGGLLAYTIVFTNGGPANALDALMVALPPDDASFASYEGPGAGEGWTCTLPAVGARGKVSCLKKSLAPGEAFTFVVTLKVDWCRAGAVLTAGATVSSTNGDVDPRDNTTTTMTTVADSALCDDGDDCTVGDQCAPGIGVSEAFDLVPVPTLPQGWTAAVVIGPFGAITWQTNTGRIYSAPNSVFAPAAPESRDLVLDSPAIPIVSPIAQLIFQNRYELEQDFDGGVLEISIGGAPFVDIVDAGGRFVTGDYNGTISERFGSPIHGRRAWTGISDGFIRTIAILPSAAAGTSVVLRWRVATDLTRGWVGQWIDSVSISGREECHAGTRLQCDDQNVCTSDACDGLGGCTNVTTVSCDDGNPCTDDPCDPTLGCIHPNNAAACNDFDVCTQTDRCSAGVCTGTNPLACGDADACTANACDPGSGCVTTSANLDAAGFSAGRVDGRDLVILAGAWNSCPGATRYAAVADLDHRDPCIEANDFHLFMDAFGLDCGP